MTEGVRVDESYRALALQVHCRALSGVDDPAQASIIMRASIARIGKQVAASIAFIGRDCKLIVLPEYVLTGHPTGESFDQWRDVAAVDRGGAQQDALAGVARDNGVYLAANMYERDPAFPDLYFQSCLIFDPAGEVALRYRRLNSFMTPTPHDVLDRYLDVYGADSLFPVARTPIGVLGCVASDEILFPEVARMLAMRGAEVLCHSTSEVASPRTTIKDVAKRARAFENMAYVVSANTGGIDGSPIPGESTDGKSQIVDYEGRVLVEAGGGESMAAYATIELASLRRARRRPGMGNMPARSRFDLYADSYAQAKHFGPNGLGDGRAPERGWFADAQRAVIERLAAEGLIE